MSDDNRGLANASDDTKQRVASAGGKAVSQDKQHMSEIGKKGGKASPTKFQAGDERTQQAAEAGGEARAQDEDVQSGELGRKGADALWNKDE